jgi:hypothetical protein
VPAARQCRSRPALNTRGALPLRLSPLGVAVVCSHVCRQLQLDLGGRHEGAHGPLCAHRAAHCHHPGPERGPREHQQAGRAGDPLLARAGGAGAPPYWGGAQPAGAGSGRSPRGEQPRTQGGPEGGPGTGAGRCTLPVLLFHYDPVKRAIRVPSPGFVVMGHGASVLQEGGPCRGSEH